MSILNQLTDEKEIFMIKTQIINSQYHLDKLKIELESMLNLIRSNNEMIYHYQLKQFNRMGLIQFLENQIKTAKIMIQNIRRQMVKLRLEIIELQIGLL